jgi:hypothetical protein
MSMGGMKFDKFIVTLLPSVIAVTGSWSGGGIPDKTEAI